MRRSAYPMLCLFLCVASPTFAAPTSILIWHTQDKEQAVYFRNLVEEFAAKHRVKFQLETGMELVPSLLTRVEGKNAPDVVFGPSDTTALVESLQLSEIPSSIDTKAIDSRALETVTVGRKQFGVPVLGGNHLFLYYNKKLVPHAPESWEDLEKDFPHGKSPKPLLGMEYQNSYVYSAFLLSFGTWPFAGDNVKLPASTCAPSLEFYKSLSDKGVVPLDCDYDCPGRRFLSGEFAYAINGDWAYQRAHKALGQDLGIALLPSIAGKPMTSFSGTHALLFPGHSLQSPKKDLLLQFAQFFQSAKIQQRWYRESGRIPVRKDALQSLHHDADPNMVVIIDQLGRARPMPPNRSLPYLWPSLLKGLRVYLGGGKDAPGACELMQVTANDGMLAAKGQKP